MTLKCILFIIVGSISYVSTSKIRLEHVVTKYYDPKYVMNPTTFTFRSKRGDSYKTNVTATILGQWGNNVSAILYYKTGESRVEQVMLKAKSCDFYKIKWVTELVKKHSDIPSCPIPAGTYHVMNLVLLRQAVLLPFPDGQNYLGMKTVLTNDDKVIYDVQGTINVT